MRSAGFSQDGVPDVPAMRSDFLFLARSKSVPDPLLLQHIEFDPPVLGSVPG